MRDNGGFHGKLGIALGALLVVTVGIFFLSGGEPLGKKAVNSDADLPPVASGQK
jgi:hypothetical protein